LTISFTKLLSNTEVFEIQTQRCYTGDAQTCENNLVLDQLPHHASEKHRALFLSFGGKVGAEMCMCPSQEAKVQQRSSNLRK
jgi:hypothetical protein